jgi:hypothetical protein
MGHEYCLIVEDIGTAVISVRPGQFVIDSFLASDNTWSESGNEFEGRPRHESMPEKQAK